jgi:hypothetical protein
MDTCLIPDHQNERPMREEPAPRPLSSVKQLFRDALEA